MSEWILLGTESKWLVVKNWKKGARRINRAEGGKLNLGRGCGGEASAVYS